MNNPGRFALKSSAYPLKAIKTNLGNQGDPNTSPYLKALLAGSSQSSLGEAEIYPMINPYREELSLPLRPGLKSSIEPEGRDWFNHYE